MKHTKQRQLIRYCFKLLSDSKLRRIGGHLADCELCRNEMRRLEGRFARMELLREEITASEDLIRKTVANIGTESDGSYTGEPSPVPGENSRRRYVFGPRGRWAAAAAVLILVGGMFIIAQFLGSGDSRTSDTSISDIEDSKDQRYAYKTTPIGKREKEDESAGEGVRKNDRSLPHPTSPKLCGAGGRDLDTGRALDTSRKWDGSESLSHGRGLGASRGLDTDRGLDVGRGLAEQKKGLAAEKVFSLPKQTEEKEGWVTEKAPFAPASNIELVVLPRRDKVQLTIYNSVDLTLVRETRNLTMKKGWNWLQFQWENTLIDPTSLSLEPKRYRDEISVEQLVFPPRLKDVGRWLIKSNVSGQVPFEITYLTSGLSWRAFYMGTLTPDETTMRLQGYVRAVNSSGEDYEDAQTRLIVGKVHLLDQIAALANRQYPYERPGEWGWKRNERSSGLRKVLVLGDTLGQDFFWSMEEGKKEIVKEGLSEYFLYTIEGTETIRNGYAKRLPSFEEDEVPVVNLYKYEQERYGDQVVRFLSFTNDQEHKLGDTPIPGGMLKVYRTVDAEGYLSYEGQSEFKYIPVNEEVELNLGAVQNVVAEPKLMGYRTENYEFDRKGNITGWDEVRMWKVTVENTRAIPVRVEIKRNFQTTYWDITHHGEWDESEKFDKNTKGNMPTLRVSMAKNGEPPPSSQTRLAVPPGTNRAAEHAHAGHARDGNCEIHAHASVGMALAPGMPPEYERYDKDTVKYTLELQPQTKRQFGYEIRTYHGTRER